jgi:flagellar biosynthetic protein FliQ
MTAEAAIDIFKNLVMFSLTIIAPFLGVILLVGLIMSLLQSVTSIQEQTLTFVPKLVVLALLLVFLAPWVLRNLSEFTVQCITRMGTMGS